MLLSLGLLTYLVTPLIATPISTPCRSSNARLSLAQLQDLFNHRPVEIHLGPSDDASTSVFSLFDDELDGESEGEDRPFPTGSLSSERPLSTYQLMALSRAKALSKESKISHNPAAAAPTAALGALRDYEIARMSACQQYMSSMEAEPLIRTPIELLFVWFVPMFLAIVVIVEVASRIRKL